MQPKPSRLTSYRRREYYRQERELWLSPPTVESWRVCGEAPASRFEALLAGWRRRHGRARVPAQVRRQILKYLKRHPDPDDFPDGQPKTNER